MRPALNEDSKYQIGLRVTDIYRTSSGIFVINAKKLHRLAVRKNPEFVKQVSIAFETDLYFGSSFNAGLIQRPSLL